jgi:hypothetical protein
MESLFSTILPVVNMGAWKPENPEAVFFDIKTADGVKRMYLAIRSDGVLTLKESDGD